ncbi:O-antigen/teichoic acid export membrane protein [Pseudorhizobium tarimense]|uniref:O-antigen/teichoic acid export membrane protein n=1 Tax=Pseudorhizobium tarimense TaxID=1079109 RepID=A0ABV2H4B9_9HYPH|nr:polysaccharide biosynthesis C-terminal domain-containing protein [Pseudorhizobium tarimense]MCJ8518617.1 polysaccharide biosynthesis C-terminal domain-containing protein [Pseudorhizobium tarimense]
MASLFLMIAMLAQPIINLVLGSGWRETAPILAWLAFAGAVGYAPTVLLPALAVSLNRARVAFEKLAIEFCVKVPLNVILTMAIGLKGLLIGHAIAALTGFLINLVVVARLTQLGILKQLAALLRPTLALIPMAVFLLTMLPLFEANDSTPKTLFNLVWICGLALAIFAAANLALWKLAGASDSCEALFLRILKSCHPL